MSTDPWFIFAFDHRNSFRGMLRRCADRDDHDFAVATKGLLFDGFRAGAGAVGDAPGVSVLIDEEYGAGFAGPARHVGARVIVPVERSGQQELSLEYGDDFGSHVQAFAPDAVKVLLRWDPDGDRSLNVRQGTLLAQVDDWMRAHDIPLIAEILTPETPDSARRADDVVRVIAQVHELGASPPVWKLEGFDDTAHARAVADAMTAGGRQARGIVLGRGVSLERAEQWLHVAAPVAAFNGFAIGKTLWQEPMEAHLRGQMPREDAVAEIGRRYRKLIDVWTTARAR